MDTRGRNTIGTTLVIVNDKNPLTEKLIASVVLCGSEDSSVSNQMANRVNAGE